MTLLSVLVSLPALGLSVLSLWLLAEVAAPRTRRNVSETAQPGPIAVIIPAHDEEAGIVATVQDVLAQLRPRDRLIVVADNCSDGTAEAARKEGAETIERHDLSRRGKGYALQYGLDHLRQEPPSTVFFTDADCLHDEGLLLQVAATAEADARPAQALYLMHASDAADPSRRIAAFAWLLINKVRMGGLWTLARTTRLVGAGAAFPWAIADKLALGSSEIVEDLALTLTLAEGGTKVSFVPQVAVHSTFPDSDQAATVQRARWEHGSLRVSRAHVPALLLAGLRKPWKAALALDVAMPPITMFVVWIAITMVLGLIIVTTGVMAPLLLSVLAAAATGLSLVIAYCRDGRDVLPADALLQMPGFVASKFGVYGKAGRDSTKSWTRTPRDKEHPEGR